MIGKVFWTTANLNLNMIIKASHGYDISAMTRPINYQGILDLFHREAGDDSIPNQEFLVVTPSKFFKAEVVHIKPDSEGITIEYRDCTTQSIGIVRIEVGDLNPRVLFINWNDIRKMVINDTTASINPDELLEFDFSEK